MYFLCETMSSEQEKQENDKLPQLGEFLGGAFLRGIFTGCFEARSLKMGTLMTPKTHNFKHLWCFFSFVRFCNANILNKNKNAIVGWGTVA